MKENIESRFGPEEKPEVDITLEEEGGSAESKIRELREKLKEAIEKKDEYLAGWQRNKADFINARKEEEKRRQEIIKFSEAEIIKDFLPVLDSFETALNSENWQKLDKDWQKGVKSIYNQLLNALNKNGIEEINSKNNPFDPKEHEAMGEIEVDDKNKDSVVLEESRKGYKMDGRVLRPAQVIIGKYK